MFSGAARLRALVGARGGARCARCGSPVLADVVDVDHVQPIALGGEDTDGNVQVLCRSPVAGRAGAISDRIGSRDGARERDRHGFQDHGVLYAP
ncbi:HNH endonuclease [Streptomyces sp. NBC_00829]|nr:HNH endonuclease [Streptomyces sp. NBC_00829]